MAKDLHLQRSVPVESKTPGVHGRLGDPDGLRMLVAQLGEGFYVADTHGAILDANPGFLRLFGLRSAKPLAHLRLADLLAEPAEWRNEHQLLQRYGSVRGFEFSVRLPNGTTRTVLDSAVLIKDTVTGQKLVRGVMVDITERKQLESHLLDASIRDPLTGCYNRRWLPSFERAAANRGWGCIIIDLDQFKNYNDTHGHAAGDQVLLKVSRLLMRQARAEEGVVRMGGDEFAVLLQGSNPSTTRAVAERLRRAGQKESVVPFSLGYATRERGERLAKTIARADCAMFGFDVRRNARERRKA